MRIQWQPYVWNEPHPLDSQVLDQLEQQWGVRLPELYREIVSTHQGMGPEPCAFDVGTGNDAFSVLLIVSTDSEKEPYSISKAHQVLQPHVPAGIFPFALTPGGEYLCFDYRDSPAQPKVVLVSMEMTIYPVADSFTVFMAGLYNG
ncbi:SMI1/KNR4 family protein [Archangium lansingense]|uniref:SMI1/KNR4 family protein n=1 Tax=Archangium lansingense TaxID=2995310 RepID=A0ABT4ACY5_9BACT|nr:SMI1/KNR4 family protein [Archangium lansinium]MCY1079538.1 SMI1/KNR4 family protein [Archangium lansinium]